MTILFCNTDNNNVCWIRGKEFEGYVEDCHKVSDRCRGDWGGLLEGGGKLASLKRISLENIFYRDGIFLGGVLQRAKEAERMLEEDAGKTVS